MYLQRKGLWWHLHPFLQSGFGPKCLHGLLPAELGGAAR